MKDKDLQVFYDPTNHRWRYYKWLFIISGILLSVGFFAALLNIANLNSLPSLNLQISSPKFRGVTSSFQSTNPNENISKDKTQFDLVKLNPKEPTNASPTDSTLSYKPKTIAFFVNWDDTSFSSLKANYNSIDELDPEWVHLQNEYGDIIIDDQDRQNEVLDFLEKNKPDLTIVPLINNYNSDKQIWDSDLISKMLANPQARLKNIDSLLNFVIENKFSGICIDYENIPDQSQQNLVLFMKELYEKFHAQNLQVSQAIPVEDPSFDIKSLAQSNDFLILMAYDEHFAEGKSGPIASQSWLSKSLATRFKDLPDEKYIIAIGNYAYDWNENNHTSQTYTFQDAIRVAKESATSINLDSKSLNPTYSYYDDSNDLHTVYMLDAITTFNEINLLKQSRIHGYALWRLGSEDPSIWTVLDSKQDLNSDVANSIKTIKYGYDIDYEGNGEVLKVSETPQDGNRDIVFDNNNQIITGEEIKNYPSPYIVDEWGGQDSKKIALTFDDGPDPNYTPRILDILKENNVKATFFAVGINATQNQGLLKRIYSEGNEIGNHTFTHPNISTLSDSAFTFELNTFESLIESAIGHRTLLFRPPYSEDVEPETPSQVRPLALTTRLGYYTVGMHIDPKDWSQPGVDNIVNNTISSAMAGDGNVVLLHDSGGDRSQTLAALPIIIEKLKENGFEIVPLSELVGVSRDSIMPSVTGNVYYTSNLSKIAFISINFFLAFLYYAFTIGIVLGVGRFTFILSLATVQWWKEKNKKFPSIVDYHPKVSVIVPAYNEEKVILRTVDSLLESTYPKLDIIVVDDGSTDRTFELVQKKYGKHPKVKLFTKINGGKSEALNFGINLSNAEIVITLDADTIFNKDTIEKLAMHFADSKIGAVAGNAKVGNRLNLITYWQALEYITSQNLDRRAFDVLNCITVVPGSIGAWRRKAILRAGGFSNRTLAEDADLTFFIIRFGYKVSYEDEALAFTEAPDTVKGFIKQRFRWMYGTLQTAWKHKDAINCPGCRALGFFSLPNIFIFQIFFPLISPLMDLTILFSIFWASWQKIHHPLDYSASYAYKKLLIFYLFFLLIDFLTSAIAFLFERKEDWSLLIWLFLQRFFYRQLMYYVAIKVFLTALKGKLVGWGKLERKATVTER